MKDSIVIAKKDIQDIMEDLGYEATLTRISSIFKLVEGSMQQVLEEAIEFIAEDEDWQLAKL